MRHFIYASFVQFLHYILIKILLLSSLVGAVRYSVRFSSLEHSFNGICGDRCRSATAEEKYHSHKKKREKKRKKNEEEPK